MIKDEFEQFFGKPESIPLADLIGCPEARVCKTKLELGDWFLQFSLACGFAREPA